MHNGDTIENLIAVVDTIHERASPTMRLRESSQVRLSLGIVTTTEQTIVKPT